MQFNFHKKYFSFLKIFVLTSSIFFTGCVPKVDLKLYNHEVTSKTSFMPSKYLINKTLPKIVVFNFDDNNNEAAKKANLGSTLAVEIESAIAINGLGKIVDRKIGKKLEKEIALSQAMNSEKSYNGPIIANYAVSGKISNADFDKKYSSGTVLYNDGNLVRIPASFKYSANVSGSAKIYQIPSMEVVDNFNFSGSAYRAENVQRTGGFLGIGGESSKGSNFDAGLMRKAADHAIRNISLLLKNSLSQDGYIMQKRSYKNKVIFKINLGSDDKIKPGDEFEIIGKFEIINPVTEEMEIEERILATGKISNIVNPKFSWIVLDKKELNDKIRIGDIVDFKYQSSLIEKIINGTKNLYYSIVH